MFCEGKMREAIDISIVIPAFNEEKRLPLFIEKVISYCNNSKYTYEIIVVDDGSGDGTLEAAESYKARYPKLHTIKIRRNRGKGYAVKRGLLRSAGKTCLFIDADGSIDPDEIEKNLRYISDEGYDIFIGSRKLKSKEQVLEAKLYRKIMGALFNLMVRTFLFKNIKDTQCGFKMFRREVVAPLFARSHIRGFGFDVEILYLAHKMGYKIKEGPISWHHMTGSTLNLFTDSAAMFFNIFQVRNWHCTPISPSVKYLGPDEYRYMYELEDYHWWMVGRRNLLAHLLKSLNLPSRAVILDVRAGTGRNLLELRKFGEVFGIDRSEHAVKFCERNGLKNIVRCGVEEMKFEDKKFDIIICFDTLEKSPDPVVLLQEMKRVLKDDGRIVIMAPALRSLWNQHDEALNHVRRYEKESLSFDIADAGLELSKMGFLFFSAFFVIAPLVFLEKLLFSRRRARIDTTTLPPKFINEFLKALFRLEINLSDRFNFPFGTMLYAVVSRGT